MAAIKVMTHPVFAFYNLDKAEKEEILCVWICRDSGFMSLFF